MGWTLFERRLCRRNPVLGGGSEGGRGPPPSESPLPQDYVYAIALGVLLLIVWSRWPR